MAATASHTITNGTHPSDGLCAPPSKRSKPMRVPPKISIADLTPNNVGTLRKLNSVLFPVAYSDKFYKEVLSPELEDYCKLIFYNDIPVGAICCRIEHDGSAGTASTSSSTQQPTGKLYLMTLGVLAPYRRQGLATRLLKHVQEKAKEASLAASLTSVPSQTPSAPATATQNAAKAAPAKAKGKAAPAATAEPASKKDASATPTPSPILKSIFVHVQTNNEDAKSFWLQQGFADKETIKDYYKKNIEGPRDAWVLEQEIES